MRTDETFDLLCVTPQGIWDPAIAIAAARAGEVGFLNLTYLGDSSVAPSLVSRLMRLAHGRYGVVLPGWIGDVGAAALEVLRDAESVLLTCDRKEVLARAIGPCRLAARRLGLIVTCEQDTRIAAELGFDFVVAKGHEAGGLVGDETTFVLLQRLVSRLGLPTYAWGGVGLATVAACRVAGAAGVVLDWQLALARESSVAGTFRRQLAAMDGSETATVPCPHGGHFRLYSRAASTAKDQLQELSVRLTGESSADTEAWDRTIGRLMTQSAPDARLWAVGQDAAFASHLTAEVPSVARILRLFRERLDSLERGDLESNVLGPGSPLASSHGTTFPVLQGPMTRVSDVPEFCEAVAAEGGLPFLALALMRQAQVRDLLDRTRKLMRGRPWGVGILGFVDRQLRSEQTDAVLAARPPFAIIAGGRPDQAAALEVAGITTYLHVPSPDLLATYLEAGSRRFIFEGRECGGHVGPRSSFVLWEIMTRVLLQAGLSDEEAAKVHVAFAGGIHDALSGSMVSAIAQPLVRRGIKVGALLGTAYLFTEEIVRTGAIVSKFQDVAISCDATALVESGPGHAIRCAESNYVQVFADRKQQLSRDGRPIEEIREELELLNMGRLRIASKGIVRSSEFRSTEDRFVTVGAAEQERDGMYMIGQIAALRRSTCTVADLHRDVCEGSVARLEALRRPTAVPIVHVEPAPSPLDVAIVGMSCLVPGATTIEELWDNVLRKRDLITEIPAHRFEADRWFDPDRRTRDKFNSRWGGFLPEISFDPFKFGIPPAALRSIEPAQLLALEVVDRALRDAGYLGSNPAKARTGVIFGVSGGAPDLGLSYGFRALLPHYIENPDESLWKQLPEWTEDSFAGILANVLAGRISNRFDLGGPNFTVDAACASSLAAIYLGCRELTARTSDMMIVGGCDTVQNPFAYLCFSKSGALSPRGRSRAFDSSADGIAISEGLAAVVLKRRDDAERDGDRIYAVIQAVASASDGRSKGLTAPRPEGQMLALRRAYAQAGFGPESVDLFEAHGTGTAVGDATECQTLAKLLAERDALPQSAAIGSIKSMIGHTKSTAGVISLIKTSLALYHRVLPPTLHVKRPNAAAGIDGGALYVNTELRPWIRRDSPRRAGVSSFGFGGTNFHAVIEGYEDQPSALMGEPVHRLRTAELVVLTGRSAEDLVAKTRVVAAQLKQAVAAGADLELADVAYTLYRRHGMSRTGPRVSVVAATIPELQEKLTAAANGLESQGSASAALGVDHSHLQLGRGTPLVFMFPGQGAQYPDMLRELAVEFAEVAACFERADAILAGSYPRRLSQFVFPAPAFDDQERLRAAEELKATEVAQPAIGVCGLALLRLMASFGVEPDMVGGHSYGELVALCAAGSLDEDDLLRLSLARGRAMRDAALAGDNADPGAMLAVHADRALVLRAVEECEDVWIANHNGPQQTVISGSKPGIARAAQRLEAAGILASLIPVACAFHSPIVAPARDLFEQALRATDLRPPTIPVFSNVTASVHSTDPDQIRRLLGEQIVREVRFVEQVEAHYQAGARVFVELGPGAVGAKLVSQILGDRPHASIAMQVRGDGGVEHLLHGLAQLILHGVDVSLDRLYLGRDLEILDLSDPARLVKPPCASHTWVVDGGTARPISEPRRSLVRSTIGPPANGQNGSHPFDHSADSVHHVPTLSTPPGVHSASAGHANGDTILHNGDRRPTTMTGAERGCDTLSAPPALQASASPATGTGPCAAHATPKSNGHASQSTGRNGAQPGSQSDIDAYADFQRTMRQFMRVQERLLEAYFANETFEGGTVGTHILRPADTMPPVPNGHTEAHGVATEASTDITIVAPTVKPPPKNGTRTVEPTAAAADLPVPSTMPTTALRNGPEPEAAERLLLEIASERTGYPAEMLGLDANLEADLGIDSIKRVEIIGAFRRAALPWLAEPPGWFMEEMAAAKSMRAILVGVAKLGGPVAVHAGAADGSGTPAFDVPVAFDSAAASGPEPEAAERLLLEIASERTGYPAEMLGLDANLEADLGIDSIKRVEIIGAFRRAALPWLAEPPGWFMEEMAAAKSMRAILAGVAKLGGPSNGRTVDPEVHIPTEVRSQPATIALDVCPRCVSEVVEEPINGEVSVGGLEGLWILSDDGQGYASEIAREIERGGGRALLIGDSDFASREAAARVVEGARKQRLAGLLHLAPVRKAPSFPEIRPKDWAGHTESELKGLLFLLQALVPELQTAKNGSFLVAAMSVGGGDFGGEGELELAHPWRGGIAGMLKTARGEWPGARFRSIDVDELPEPTTLLQEMSSNGTVEVGYRGGRRLAVRVIRKELPEKAPAIPDLVLSRRSVVLVTGGAQGITGEIVRELAEKTKATFILLGRSPAPAAVEPADTARLKSATELRQSVVSKFRSEGRALVAQEIEAWVQRLLKEREIRATLTAIGASGSKVEYLSCDVRDGAALEAAIKDVRRRLGEIDGLIHGAGIIEDRLIPDKTPESFDRVLGTKLDPMLVLVRHLSPERLKFALLFSSVAGFFGNPGQVDYAAANETLNRIAGRLKNVGYKKVVAINWGPWSGAGMVKPEVARQFESRGVPMVTLGAGRLAVVCELAHQSDDVRVLIGPGPWVESADQFRACRSSAESTPLLAGQELSHLPGSVVEATVVLDPARQPYLNHHEIDGRPVLPLAVAMELMAEVTAASQPDWYITEVQNVRMYSGVIIDGQPRTITVRAEPIARSPHDGEWRVRLSDPTQPARPLYESMVRMTAEQPLPPPAPAIDRIDQPFPMSASETYIRWLFHGRMLWVIQELRTLDSSGMDAIVRPSCPKECLGEHIGRGWLIDPIVLDAGPQIATFWSRKMYDTTVLPSRIKSFRCYGSMAGGPLEMILRVKNVEAEGNLLEATIWYLRGGRLVGLMEGLESAGNTSLNRITGSPR